jgi:ATP-binding cassette subfamily B protein
LYRDRVLVFENGRIIESGGFDELIRQGGHFAELARSQFLATEIPAHGAPRLSGQLAET